VVDNNSTDRTAELTRKFPFVIVVDAHQQGIVHARNAGFDVATGDVIGRIDADIQLPSDWIDHVQTFYKRPERVNQSWTSLGYFYNVRLARFVSFGYWVTAFGLNRLLLGHYPLWGSSMAITTKQWRHVRQQVCTRTDIHEDLDLAIHLHDAGYRITYDKSIKVQAELRRVQSERHKLWDYLGWWPRTLRVHGKKNWPICWFVGVYVLFQAAMCLAFIDYLARQLRK
jgi:glycosyltransferase involved in cell wall biosynthesis